jgi:hypothetical protein
LKNVRGTYGEESINPDKDGLRWWEGDLRRVMMEN